jgi:hypothetical protein
MEHLFHKDWTDKRVSKIVNIFGKSWFYKKNILELGACHGDVGIRFLNLGANVRFTDARADNLDHLVDKLKSYSFHPKVSILNQENDYNLGRYDLTVHMATLCHISNWRQDLRNAVLHSNAMILETSVMPIKGSHEREYKPLNHKYGPFTECMMKEFTEDAVEEQLKLLDCKFLKIVDADLNTKGWSTQVSMFHALYDWSYDDIKKSTENEIYSYRRMWLVLKD